MISSAKTRYSDNFYFYNNDSIIGRSIQLYGEYTESEIDILKYYIDKNTIIYDVGGNIGYHTVAFAMFAKKVYAFEPNDKNYLLLEKNTSHLSNVRLFQAACSDKIGSAFISDYDLTESGNYGECMISDSGQPCKTLKLDELALPLPGLIKIDVEGHELEVINGCRNIITKSQPVIFYESMNDKGLDLIFDFLKSLDYTIYFFPSRNYNPNNFYKNKNDIFGVNSGIINCLAVPKHKRKINNLPEMLERTETYKIALERYKNNQNQ